MDTKKLQKFNERMGKVQKYSKGGLIKRVGDRKYFDNGGAVAQTPVNTASTPASTTNGGQQVTGAINSTVGNKNPYALALAQPVGNVINGVGGVVQGVAGALTAQNSYNAQLAPTNQTDYSGVIGQSSSNALSGYDQYQQNQEQQQQLGTSLQNEAGVLQNLQAGVGPNPAQAALANNTATNVANQAALMAGQRGASGNVGLIARQAAQQGATTQQTAVGQAAATQAAQQIAAGQQLQAQQAQQVALAGQEGSQIIGEQGTNNQLFGTAASAQNAQNNTNVSNYAMAQGINSQVAQNNANSINKTTSGLLGGAAAAILYKGGEVGDPPAEPNAPSIQDPKLSDGDGAVPDSSGGDSGGGGGGGGIGGLLALLAKGGRVHNGPHKSQVANFLMAKGGAVPAMVSPGEIYLSPDKVKKVIEDGANPMTIGQKIKGKAAVKGDNLKNDTVKMTLEEGGVILPRHITSKKNRDHAELFVRRAVHMKQPQKDSK